MNPSTVMTHHVGYHHLPCAGDAELEARLEARYGLPPHAHRFLPVDLPIALLAEALPAELEEVRRGEGGERGHAICLGYLDRYLEGGDPAPIVVSDEGGEWAVLDGYYRATAARAAQRETIRAYRRV